jgi:hypothetical protein
MPSPTDALFNSLHVSSLWISASNYNLCQFQPSGVYLPSYSPNLNLIERLWRFVRVESLNSTYYERFDDFRTAIDGCLDGLSTVYKAEMETLMTHRFQTFEDVPLLAA